MPTVHTGRFYDPLAAKVIVSPWPTAYKLYRHGTSGFFSGMTTALRLEQKEFLKPRSYFELLPNGELLVKTKNAGGQQEVRIELSHLSPRTARYAKSAVILLVAFIVFGLIYVGIVVSTYVAFRKEEGGLVTSLGIIGFVSLIMFPLLLTAFVRWRNGTYDVTVFYNRFSGQVALSIANRVPDPATVTSFVTELTRLVEKAAPVEIRGDTLVDQLARLGDLHTKGVINAEEFASAKQRLLKEGALEKRIGF